MNGPTRIRALLACIAFSAGFVACASSNTAGTAATSRHDNAHLPLGDATRGKALADRNSCAECHGGDYSGASFYANITPDQATGIGAWTDQQIAAAIRDGAKNDGEALCSLMEHFPFSDQETADVIAFLRGLPAVTRSTTDVCPGHGNKAM